MKINQGCKTKERCEITSNPPNRTIWFVDAPLWFADAAFCISKHPTSVKNHLQFRTFSTKSLHNPNKCLTFALSVLAKPLIKAQPTTNREQCQTCYDNKNTIDFNISQKKIQNLLSFQKIFVLLRFIKRK